MTHWVWLYTVMVHPRHQGRGYGRDLMAAVERTARTAPGFEAVEAVRLNCRGGTGVDGFYAKSGYKEVGRVPDAIRVAPGTTATTSSCCSRSPDGPHPTGPGTGCRVRPRSPSYGEDTERKDGPRAGAAEPGTRPHRGAPPRRPRPGRAGPDRDDLGVPLPAPVLGARGDAALGVRAAQAAHRRGRRGARRRADAPGGRRAVRLRLREAFARAFRAVHGVGPGEARRTGAALRSQPRMSFRLVVEGNSSMRYRIVEKDAFRIVGRGARVPLVHEGRTRRSPPTSGPSARRPWPGSPACRTGSPRASCRRSPTSRTAARRRRAGLLARGGERRRRAGGVRRARRGRRDLGRLRERGPLPEGPPVPLAGRLHPVVPVQPVREQAGSRAALRTALGDWTTARAELWIPVERTGV